MKKRITVKGITLEFSTEVPPMGLAYKNDKGDEAVFTYAKEKQHLFGNIYTADGKTFEIERCQSTHVFREVKSNTHKDRGTIFYLGTTIFLRGSFFTKNQ